jgi:hypothetical protein
MFFYRVCMKQNGEIIVLVLFLCVLQFSNTASFALDKSRLEGNSSKMLISSATSHEGNIYVNDSETLSINDCEFNETGTIYVQEDGTLEIQNANVTLILPFGISASDVLIVKDNGSVLIANSTISLVNHDFQYEDYLTLSSYNQSRITFASSTINLTTQVGIEAYDFSRINVENTKLIHKGQDYWYGELLANGNSSLDLENSTAYSLTLYDSSQASVTNSILNWLQTGIVLGKTAVNVSDSNIDTVASWGKGSCKYFVENSFVNWLEIGPGSAAYVGYTSGNQLNTDANSTTMLEACNFNNVFADGVVLVANWFFGLSLPWIPGVPFTWVLPIEIFVVLEVLTALIVLRFAVRKARSKKNEA